MVLGVLERPIDFLYDAFDRIGNFTFLMKCQLDFDRRGQTIEPFRRVTRTELRLIKSLIGLKLFYIYSKYHW